MLTEVSDTPLPSCKFSQCLSSKIYRKRKRTHAHTHACTHHTHTHTPHTHTHTHTNTHTHTHACVHTHTLTHTQTKTPAKCSEARWRLHYLILSPWASTTPHIDQNTEGECTAVAGVTNHSPVYSSVETTSKTDRLGPLSLHSHMPRSVMVLQPHKGKPPHWPSG